MAALAAFAASGNGQAYAAVCRSWGVDPAAGFTDDVMAFNLRAALMPVPAVPPVDDWEAAGAALEEEWLKG